MPGDEACPQSPFQPETAGEKISVTTYHDDNLRTGWNGRETALTPSAVRGGDFKLISAATVDDQVDAQPLPVSHVSIAGRGVHDVIYLATEGNSVYAIDAATGEELLHKRLGAPVGFRSLPGQCDNNGPNVGIDSTPVIDPSSNTMYAVAYAMESGVPTFRIHALDLSTLADKVQPTAVAASAVLNDGATYEFSAASDRQRSALLLSHGNVYAGFGSFCDQSQSTARGWVLGWQANSLSPLPGNHLNNALAHSSNDAFLTGVWMSGYSLAADDGGDVYFATSNSDYSGTSYSAVTNLSESVVELSSDLRAVKSYFSPPGVGEMDRWDGDLGAGGVMLLPKQRGSLSSFAETAGKSGILYLLDAADLGHDRNAADRRATSAATPISCPQWPTAGSTSQATGRCRSSA